MAKMRGFFLVSVLLSILSEIVMLNALTNANGLSNTTSTSTTIEPVFEKFKFDRISSEEKFRNILLGSTTLLNCTVNSIGFPLLKYTWYKDKEELPKPHNSSWIIEARMLEQTGTYSCKVCSGTLCLPPRRFFVTILRPEKIYMDKCGNQSVEITCDLCRENSEIKLYEILANGSEKLLLTSNSKDYFRETIYVNQTTSYRCSSPCDGGKVPHKKRNFTINFEECDHNNPVSIDLSIQLLLALLFLCVVIVVVIAGMIGLKLVKKCMENSKKKRGDLELSRVPIENPRFRRLVVETKKSNDCSDDNFGFDIREECVLRNDTYDPDSMYGNYIIPLEPDWEMNANEIRFDKVLGEGAFGIVYLARMYGISGPDVETSVAVKTLKDSLSPDYSKELDKNVIFDLKNLFAEMETMKRIGYHKNVITLLGCCTPKMYLIMEYAANGSLKDFLRKYYNDNGYESNPRGRSIDQMDVLKFSLQIAEGMEYLANLKYVHRDLAARNILVAADYTLKIADFGLTRNVIENDYYRTKQDGTKQDSRVPYKWMAPEALSRRIFTTQSDVWSFGIVMWEVYTMGSIPYADVNNGQMEVLLKKGMRLHQPDNCSIKPFYLMRECWRYDPKDRQPFSYIVEELKNLINDPGMWEVTPFATESSDDSDSKSTQEELH